MLRLRSSPGTRSPEPDPVQIEIARSGKPPPGMVYFFSRFHDRLPSSVTTHDTIIIGGGISGAAALHWLARSGATPLLLESSPSLGGVIATRRTPAGALVETGPNTLQFSNRSLVEMIDELGLGEQILQPGAVASNRYVMRDGQLIPLPTSPKSFRKSPLFSSATRRRVLGEFLSPPKPSTDPDESVAAFVERHFGREILEYAVDPFVSGIFAGDPERLSLRNAFPRFHAIEAEHRSMLRGMMKAMRARKRAQKQSGEAAPTRRGIFSFTEGLGALPQAIAARWGRMVRTNTQATAVVRAADGWQVRTSDGSVYTAPSIVLATTAGTAASLLNPIDAEGAAALRGIEHPPVLVMHSLYRRESVEHPLDGFGMLMPRLERRRILGSLFSSSLFPNRAPEGTVLLTSFIGGARAPELTTCSREEAEYVVHGELRRTLGICAPPVEVTHTLWPAAIPQYTIGYERTLEALSAVEARHPGLHLLGSYRGGVAVGDTVQSARTLAEQLIPGLQQSTPRGTDEMKSGEIETHEEVESHES